MGRLTEVEIFSQMSDALGDAVDAAQDLAVNSRKGPSYDKLRKNLHLIEGCVRQAAYWREDTRWLPIAKMMGDAHKKSGDWLRGYKDPVSGLRVAFGPGQVNTLFVMFAENLANLRNQVELLKTQKTGKSGLILPEMPYIGRRPGAPVPVSRANGHNHEKKSPGGIILGPTMH